MIAAVLDSGGTALLRLEFLTASDFHGPEHRAIYDAALTLWSEGGIPDYVTVTELLSPRYPGAKALIDGYHDVQPNLDRVEEYARVVSAKSLGRRLVDLGERTAESALTGEPVKVLEEAERSFLSLRPSRGDGFQRLGLFAPASVGAEPSELPTGYRNLDRSLGGLGTGRLICMAARPGVGKTTLATNVACYVASTGHKVGIYSLEMSTTEILERIIAAESGVDIYKVREKILSIDDIFNISKALWRISKWELSIDDTSSMSVLELSTRAKREKAERGLDLLVVDYLGLLTPPEGVESRVEQVSEITRQLKRLSRELDIPVIAVSQLNRKSEDRGTGEPRLSDLRDSGSVEQDSDQVIFLWRDAPDDHYSPVAITDCKVAKNRHGPTWQFQMSLLKAQSRFYE